MLLYLLQTNLFQNLLVYAKNDLARFDITAMIDDYLRVLPGSLIPSMEDLEHQLTEAVLVWNMIQDHGLGEENHVNEDLTSNLQSEAEEKLPAIVNEIIYKVLKLI